MKRLIRLPSSRSRDRRELENELSFHLEGRIEDLMTQGLSREDATREALRRFGDLSRIGEQVEAIDATTRRQRALKDRLSDALMSINYALRSLTKRPLFSAAVIVTLALGIGANSAMFSVLHGVLMRPFDFPQIGQLAVVRNDYSMRGMHNAALSPLEALDLSERTNLFSTSAATMGEGATLEVAGEPTRTVGARTLGDFFGLLGVSPSLGRFYRPEDSQQGRQPVVVLSHRLWLQLSADSSIVGRSIVINDATYQVIGVAPPDFAYPRTALYWRPLILESRWLDQETQRGTLMLSFVGRMRDGLDINGLTGELRALTESWHSTHRSYDGEGHSLTAMSFVDWQAGQLKPAVIALFAAVVLVLLLACANVIGLQLVRASSRSRELAVRAALGAGRRAIVGQLFVESAILTLAGAGLGLLLGKGALAWLTYLNVERFPALSGLSLNGNVLAFTIAVTLAAGLLVGVAPGLRATRIDVSKALRSSGRGSSTGAARHRALRISVVVQNAVAMLLLVGAGLTIKSLSRIANVDPGFQPEHVVSFTMSLPRARYTNAEQRLAFFSQLERSLAATPGVQSVGFALGVPFVSGGGSTQYHLPTVQARSDETMRHANQAYVFGDYFRTMGINIVRGRPFEDADFTARVPLMVVDETLVEQSFKDANPLGVAIRHGGPEGTIIGVARSVKLNDLSEEAHPLVYSNYAAVADGIGALTGVVRSTLPTEQVLAATRRAVNEIDRTLPISNGTSLSAEIEQSLGARRLIAYVLGSFAALAQVLALLGVYAVMSHVVSDRTREIGIRSALGAQNRQIAGMVLSDGMLLAVAGLAIGGVAFLGVRKALESVLYGVGSLDTATIVSAAAVLGGATLLACYVPAWRAMRVDPSIALQGE